MRLDQKRSLKLIKLYKRRSGQRHSWREVHRAIVRAGHPHAFLVTGQKLANWDHPKRYTELEDRGFEAVQHFMCSETFQEIVPEVKDYLPDSKRSIDAGMTMTALAGIYDAGEIEDVLYKALEGMWCDRGNLVYLYIHKVKDQNFAIVHLCQKIHSGYKSALGFPIRDYENFYASGFLYFENATHSKNKDEFADHPKTVGVIKNFSNGSDIHRIGVSGKQMRLKLYSRESRYEVNFNASCEASISDSGYESSVDGSMSVSSFFRINFNSTTEPDDRYSFTRAQYPSEYFYSKDKIKTIKAFREEFDQNKWSVVPHVVS